MDEVDKARIADQLVAQDALDVRELGRGESREPTRRLVDLEVDVSLDVDLAGAEPRQRARRVRRVRTQSLRFGGAIDLVDGERGGGGRLFLDPSGAEIGRSRTTPFADP